MKAIWILPLLFSAAAFAEPPAKNGAEATKTSKPGLSELLTQAKEALTDWRENAEIEIAILKLTELTGSDESGRVQLHNRLKSLLNKKRSNREWHEYWNNEAKITKRLVGIYDQMVTDGKGPLATAVKNQRTALAKATATNTQSQQRLNVAEQTYTSAKATLSEHGKALTKSVTALKAAAVLAEETQKAAAQSMKRAEKALSRASDTNRTDKTQALEAAKAALSAAQVATAGAKMALRQTQDSIKYIASAIADPKTKSPELTPKTSPIATAFLKSYEALQTAQKNQKNKETATLSTKAGTLKLTAMLSNISARKEALNKWQALATAKVANQDVYFKAITADIEAVEERLAGYKDTEEFKYIGMSKAICEKKSSAKTTSVSLHYKCVEATRGEISELEEKLDQNEAVLKLTNTQLKSVDALVDSQKTDAQLGAKESAIATTENERCRRNNETASWTQLWNQYSLRSKDKKLKLKNALQHTKGTKRALLVNLAFHKTEQEQLTEKLTQAKALLEERASIKNYIVSIVKTAGELILGKGYVIAVYLLLAWLLLKLNARVASTIVARKEQETDANRDDVQRTETLANVGRGAIRLLVGVATTLLILDALTVDIGPILGGAAIFGLAISFGSQSLVKDVVTGFFILLENQYAVGDVVEISGSTASVEKITLRRTVLRDVKGGLHSIPNGSISSVINFTQGWARVVHHVGVAYDADLSKVEEVIDKVGDEMYADPEWQDKLDEPPRYVGVVSLDDSAVLIRTMFKTQTFENWGAEREFNLRIKKAFDAAGIGIPFPQMDLHVNKLS